MRGIIDPTDFVYAVANLHFDEKGRIQPDTSELLGTAFLFGQRGYALTAAHVARTLSAERGCLMTPGNPEQPEMWGLLEIEEQERHSEQDVSILRVRRTVGDSYGSWAHVASSEVAAGQDYRMVGYPDAIAREAKHYEGIGQSLRWNPDLVCFRGYVRRRISRVLPTSNYEGNAFYELSEVAGACCSGSPVYIPRVTPGWDVIGVYVGETTSDHRAGYAVRSTCIANWAPKLLGHSIAEECA